jgi:hypothetical protein
MIKWPDVRLATVKGFLLSKKKSGIIQYPTIDAWIAGKYGGCIDDA